MSTINSSSLGSTAPSDLGGGVGGLLNTEHFCRKGEFGVRGSGGGVVEGAGGINSSIAETPRAPGNLHGGTDWALFVLKPPESMRSQSALLSGVNVTLTREGDEATLPSGVPL